MVANVVFDAVYGALQWLGFRGELMKRSVQNLGDEGLFGRWQVFGPFLFDRIAFLAAIKVEAFQVGRVWVRTRFPGVEAFV